MRRTWREGRHPSAVITLLSRAQGRIVSREALLDAMYGREPNGGPTSADSVLKVTIHWLRKALPPGALQTVWGVGYRLDPKVDVSRWLLADPEA